MIDWLIDLFIHSFTQKYSYWMPSTVLVSGDGGAVKNKTVKTTTTINNPCPGGVYIFREIVASWGHGLPQLQTAWVAEPGPLVNRVANIRWDLTYVNTARHCFKCFTICINLCNPKNSSMEWNSEPHFTDMFPEAQKRFSWVLHSWLVTGSMFIHSTFSSHPSSPRPAPPGTVKRPKTYTSLYAFFKHLKNVKKNSIGTVFPRK